ncbi:VWA-like domain-containing protein [Halomonas sp. TD01]|uniref:VWA-like domain-containing protein n=1 Tax=Halomonas sp. TD01 TaxID=999141 RepID=UPI001E77F2CC|nr:VWA-like domain-containing protein [Halomonas sp. TD01]CAH1044023.1 hypothetical protein HPTD01_2501 [Halomonas sp. TD01]
MLKPPKNSKLLPTSSSCQRALPYFLSELVGILAACDRLPVDVIEFDSQIIQRSMLHEGQLHELAHWQRQGGGGSDIRSVFESLAITSPSVLVALTDEVVNIPAFTRLPSDLAVILRTIGPL